MATTDYYKVLGVDKNASDADIKSAYRKLARKYHPDVNKEKSAEERFRDINRAYQVLGDPEKRKKYDQFGADFEKFDGMPHGAGQHYGPTGGGGGPRINFEDLFGAGARAGGGNVNFGADGNFGDILGDLFAGFGGGARTAGRGFTHEAAPPPSEHRLDVTLEEAFSGGQRALEVAVDEACSTCRGRGLMGHGMCQYCGGRGTRPNRRRLTVTIPPGVTEGTKLRMRGEGNAGSDLYLTVHLLPHDRFEVKDGDLHGEVFIPVADAALGGEVAVHTLKGSVTMRIPPETQNGKVFRLANQGLPAFGKRPAGHLYVKARLTLPTSLSAEEKALFEQLQRLRKKSGNVS